VRRDPNVVEDDEQIERAPDCARVGEASRDLLADAVAGFVPSVRSAIETSKQVETQILELRPRFTTSLMARAPLEERGDRGDDAGPIVIGHVLHRSAQRIR
jgi:hypothetical protein